jgi:hypothetical protein
MHSLLASTARPLTSLAASFAWAFVSFIFVWDMLLPIAR